MILFKIWILVNVIPLLLQNLPLQKTGIKIIKMPLRKSVRTRGTKANFSCIKKSDILLCKIAFFLRNTTKEKGSKKVAECHFSATF